MNSGRYLWDRNTIGERRCGFHSDNGSEFVNRIVAQLLNKMLIRFTKSRPRHTNDNGLVESKNGSVVRKQC